MEKSIINLLKKKDTDRIKKLEKKMDDIEEISMAILRAIDNITLAMVKSDEHKVDISHTGYNADTYDTDGDATDDSE